MKPYEPVVAALLNQWRAASILDAPSGSGWLAPLLRHAPRIDGADLFEDKPPGYSEFRKADLDAGLPDDLGSYEAVVCCEGIEHFGNPDVFFKSALRRLLPGGHLVVTTPNVWYPQAKLQFLLRGFFPGFPSLIGRIERGTHMHIMPWSFAHLYLYLRLNGFEEIALHDLEEPKPRSAYEWLFGWPQTLYCRRHERRAQSDEERSYWRFAGSRQSVYGRRLVVSARAPL